MHETNAFDNYHPQALVRTLKTFAFEQSTAFRDDRLAEVELSKSLTYRDPELNRNGDFIKTSLGFVATRLYPEQGWPKLGYAFTTTLATESSIDSIPEAIMVEYTEAGTAPEELYDPEVDDLSQTLATSLTVDTIYPRDIDTTTSYHIRCNNVPVWESDTDELSRLQFDRVKIPRPETSAPDDRAGKRTLADLDINRPVTQERFDDVEHGLVAIAFEQVIGTLSLNDPAPPFYDYDDRARQILHIIAKLRNND